MKKFISCILLLSMIFTMCAPQTFALTTDTAGEKFITLDLADYSSITNGEYVDSVLKLKQGGKVVYNVYIPFGASSVDLVYALPYASANISVKMNGKEYTSALSSTSATLAFGDNLSMGEYTIEIATDNAINLSSFEINRVQMLGGVLPNSSAEMDLKYDTVPALTDYEKAIQTAIIVSSDSPVIMVNGGRRYVNNDDAREVPYVENSEVYLPMHSFARAFEYYYEEKGDEWIITKDQNTFHYKDGVLTRQDYSSDPYVIENITKTVNSKTYFPLKYFAELEGKVIQNKDNLYIVEYPSNAKAILKDAVFNELSANYAEWKLEEKTGNTYYVSKECKSCDDNDGSYRKPFKTLKKAAEVAQAGDTVIIRGGTYHETLAPKNNGTVSNPIVFKAAEGEEVTLSATAYLGAPVGFKFNANYDQMLVYKALGDLGYGRNQIFYNKENLTAGIHPNEDTNPKMNLRPENLSKEWGVQGNLKVSTTDSSIVTSTTDLGQKDDFWNGATVIAYAGNNGWTLGTAKVSDSTSGKLTVTDKTVRWWRAGSSYGTDYGWLTNHINTVDEPGEWAIEDGKIYILPPEGETAESLQLEQKVRQVLMDLSDNKYVRVEGINTYGGGMKMNNSEMCMLRDGEYEYISHYTYSKDQRDGYIDDANRTDPNGAPQRGEMGIYLGGRDNIIINNRIQYSAAAGIFSVGCYEYIENNQILDCGYMSSYVGGLFIGTEGWKTPDTPRGGNAIYSNTLHRAGRHAYGYSTYEGWYGSGATVLPAFMPSEFAYNDIKDGSIHARDTAPWYQYGTIAGTERMKTRDHHNLVANSWANDGTMNSVVYYDGWTSMFQNYNNVMYWTNNGVEYDEHLFRQNGARVKSVIDVWNNSALSYVEGGKEAITTEMYPKGKKFATGAKELLTDKTPYIDSMDEDLGFINLCDAVVSENAKIENGLFRPSADGDWICFENVDFSQKQNKISIYYTGDRVNTGDTVSIIVGNSLDDYDVKKTVQISTELSKSGMTDVEEIRFSGAHGVKNLYIRIDDYKSINIEQIKLEYIDDLESNVRVGVYADGGTLTHNQYALGEIPSGETHQIYYSKSGAHEIIKYEDVVVPVDCNTFFVRAATSGTHTGHEIWVTIESSSGEKIVSFKNNKTSWFDYSMEAYELNRTLEAGTYDVYVQFKTGKKSNFLWFGFGVDGSVSDM